MNGPATVFARASLALVLLAALSACGDDTDPVGVAGDLVGTWEVTSFQAIGLPDLIGAGMGLTITLTEDEYTFTVTNDQAGICEGLTDCVDAGSYSATSTQITLDPGTPDAITFNYTIQGSSMTWTGTIGGFPVTIGATRV
jgi:hypothetical protein